VAHCGALQGEPAADIVAVVVGGLLDQPGGRCCGGGSGEGAATEIGLGEELGLGGEDGEQPSSGVVLAFDGGVEPRGGGGVPLLQVGADELFLAADSVVEGGLGDPGVLDDVPLEKSSLQVRQRSGIR
jgi:hypothetical protein